ncbi:hypothetical protein V500_05778 [Pseudogymnoascus sp. VKM F-4518 (FW-2643)]|nr:hypothetical protein V500_05778 [Pseudogymnoascus sp. VKM F-4518 (FW-2643)]
MSNTAKAPPVNGELHDCWGYKFRWTDLHQTEEELKPLLYTYDSLGSEVLERIQKHKVASGKATTGPASREDLFTTVKALAVSGEDEVINKFWHEVNTIPDWVDWDQIKRGQDVFYRYGEAFLIGGTFSSLVAGMGAARIAETLARTGGFAPKVGRKRMFETTQHLLNVTKTLESIQPGGQGWLDSVRVRLLHASVRSRILGMVKTRPSYYDVESFGVPINDQDTIATIATYSSQALWLALPSQGIYLKQQEIEDYIQLWRLVGYYMGTPTDVFKTAETSKAYFDSVLEADVKPTEISKVLANNIITSLADQPPHFPSKDFLHAQSRVYNGEELCDALAIPKASYLGYVKAYLQVVLLMTVAYLFRSFSFLDKWRIQYNKKSFWELVTGEHGLGGETKYKMQYVPEFDAISKLEKVGSGASVATKNIITMLAVVVPMGAVGAMYAFAK